MKIKTEDRKIIRNLAKKVDEYAKDPINDEKRNRFIKHNKLKQDKPIVLVFPEGSWDELITEDELKCEGEKAREIEFALRSRIYYYERLKDDSPIEKSWFVEKRISGFDDFGLKAKRVSTDNKKGAYHIEPVLNEYSDLKKIKAKPIEYDEKESEKRFEFYKDLFGDILDVQLTGKKHISFHLMNVYINLRGYERLFYDFYDEPEFIHETMRKLTETYKDWIKDLEKYKLLSLNNDETYHSSGGYGYTDEIPKADFDPNHVKLKDMWSSAEVQELSDVSPQMHYEFAMKYEIELLEHFALNGYGCCEPLHNKFDYVFKIPRLRRISVSPWADVEISAKRLKRDYIYSWKPNPSYLAGTFEEDKIRDYIANTLNWADKYNCNIEMILKDTHTCYNEPERFDKWMTIARELINKYRK